MPSELEIAKNAVAEIDLELERVSRELGAQVEARSNLMKELSAATASHNGEQLITVMDRTKAIDQAIANLASQRQHFEAERKRVEQKAKEVERKAENLRKGIGGIEERLSPRGDIGRRIVEAEKTLDRYSPDGDIGKLIREDEHSLERVIAGGDLAQQLREAQHILEMEIRFRGAIEKYLSGLRSQLEELVGTEEQA